MHKALILISLFSLLAMPWKQWKGSPGATPSGGGLLYTPPPPSRPTNFANQTGGPGTHPPGALTGRNVFEGDITTVTYNPFFNWDVEILEITSGVGEFNCTVNIPQTESPIYLSAAVASLYGASIGEAYLQLFKAGNPIYKWPMWFPDNPSSSLPEYASMPPFAGFQMATQDGGGSGDLTQYPPNSQPVPPVVFRMPWTYGGFPPQPPFYVQGLPFQSTQDFDRAQLQITFYQSAGSSDNVVGAGLAAFSI